MLWYWAQFGVAGGPKTLVLSRVGKTQCYRVQQQDDNGSLTPALGAVLTVGTADGQDAGQHAGGRGLRREAQGATRPRRARRGRAVERRGVRRLALVLAAVAALTGCGSGESGKATLWITRDRGAKVLLQRQVPAGLTAMQALDRVADIETRYGGRYVQSIDGIEGSLEKRRDWFYFVNGYEADRSAAEYRLHEGDVEWWDFRSWQGKMRAPIVVGAFPEPFLHGFGGKRRPARVVYFTPDQRDDAERVANVIHGRATTDVTRGGSQALECSRAHNGAQTGVSSIARQRAGGCGRLRVRGRSGSPVAEAAVWTLRVRGRPVRPAATLALLGALARPRCSRSIC